MRAPVLGVRPSLDQPVTFHADQRVGHRRLFDAEPLHEFALRQAVFIPQRQQRHELGGRQAKRPDALLQAVGKQPRHVVGQESGGSFFLKCHACQIIVE